MIYEKKLEQIKEGLRVIRPQSCTPKEENKFRDGQELGTISKVTEKGDVHVQWDTGGTDVFEKGINNNYKLLLFDNAQIGQVQQFLEKKIETFRSDAKVKWNDDSEERYSVSRHGQCDLKFTTASKGTQNVEKGIRVVRGPGWDKKNVDDGGPDYMGTVTNELHNVTVQWDNGKIRTYDLSDQNLRLFDNGPSGVEHPDYVCKTCPAGNTNIRGIRWKCTECEYFDLCNMCYMSDKHDLNHKFQRILAIDESEQIVDPREDSKSHIRQSYGIFEGAKVEEVKKIAVNIC
ncbi:MIB [Mytilus edulis]|uniref:MIB n=1 Tax=Mytilus edulis TaxID=6550 RepID=A0A8S3UTM8_MYTED|nr:MIB [Mytilus edulis]